MEGPRPEDARVGNFPVNTAEDIPPLETDDVTESPDDVKEEVGNGQPVKQGNVIKGKSRETSETHGAAREGGGEGRGGSNAPVFNKDLDEKFAPGVEEPGQESEEEFEEDWIENEIGEEEGKGGSVVKTTMERVSIFEEDPLEELEMQRPGETGSPDQACAYWPEEEPEAMQYEQRAKQVQREEAERGEEIGDVTYYQPRPLDITPTSSAVPEDVIEDAAGVNRAFIMRDKIGYPCRGTDPSTASALRLLSKRSHGAVASLLAGMTDLWIAQECTDIELLVETTVFRCHRTVLAAVSGYFRSMLASGMRESHSLRMHVSEVNADTMAAVLEEVYQQRDDVITPENVDMIFRAAAFLQISFLETACCDVMKRCITADNCLGVWRLGKAYNRTDLEKSAVAIIREEFTEVVQSEEFVDLEVVDLRDLLAALPVDESIGEEERVKSILTWVEAEEEQRGGHLVDLLQECVCCLNLSQKFFHKELYQRKQCSKDERFKALVDDIIAYYMNPDKAAEVASRQVTLRSDQFCRVHLVLCGSFTHGDPLPNLACLEPASKTWYTLHAIKREWMPGDDFATCVLDNRVYVTGGSRKPLQTLCFSPSNNKWVKVKDLLGSREQHAMAAVQGKLYIVGGRRQAGPVGEVEAYDVTKDSWSRVGALTLAVESPSCGVLGDQLYVIGGRDDDDDPTSLIQVFSTTTGTCSRLVNLLHPTASSRVVAHQGVLWAVLQDGAVVQVKANGEAKQVATLSDGERRQFGLWVENGELWVLGGLDATDQILDKVSTVNLTSGKVKVMQDRLPIPFFGFGAASVVISKELLQLQGFMLQEELSTFPHINNLTKEKKKLGRVNLAGVFRNEAFH